MNLLKFSFSEKAKKNCAICLWFWHLNSNVNTIRQIFEAFSEKLNFNYLESKVKKLAIHFFNIFCHIVSQFIKWTNTWWIIVSKFYNLPWQKLLTCPCCFSFQNKSLCLCSKNKAVKFLTTQRKEISDKNC